MLLAFAGVRPGMKVLEVGAGAGYSAELLARSVGPQGVVYARNSPDAIARFIRRASMSARQAGHAQRGQADREFDDPVPATCAVSTSRPCCSSTTTRRPRASTAQNEPAHFDALRPAALCRRRPCGLAGSGVSARKTLHRIDAALVRQEVEAAGFKFVAAADFLRDPDDPRTGPHLRVIDTREIGLVP